MFENRRQARPRHNPAYTGSRDAAVRSLHDFRYTGLRPLAATHSFRRLRVRRLPCSRHMGLSQVAVALRLERILLSISDRARWE